MKYLIRVQANHGCWIADTEGDPGRTITFENAKSFTKEVAEIEVKKLKGKYPNRAFEVEPRKICMNCYWNREYWQNPPCDECDDDLSKWKEIESL